MEIKLFPINESPLFWLYRTRIQSLAAMRRAFQAAGYDVTPEQWGVLVRVGKHEGMSQSQLGKDTLKDRHNITRIVNHLEKRGYIERRPDNIDKRAYRLFLTKPGKIIKKKLTPVVFNHLQEMFNGLSSEDLRTLLRIFKHTVNNLEKKLT
jgi:DNA-binding MarR family transcriptional regulator